MLDGVSLDRPGVGATGRFSHWPAEAHRFHGAGVAVCRIGVGTLCMQWRPSAPNLRQLAPAGLPTEAKGGPPLGRSFVVDRAARRTVAGGSVDGPRETTMTKHADFKGRVRARMAKTGESYATARIQLLTEQSDVQTAGPVEEWMTAALHVSNGDSTDLPGTGLARHVLYWRDSLHEGPVPAVGSETLRRVRADFLVKVGVDDRGEGARMFLDRDRVLEAHRDGEYVLWFEADLYDQLQIIQILARLDDLGVPAQRITLICIGEHAGIARFGGLGELSAEQLRELPATNACARLTPAALQSAVRAWAAFRAPTPDGLAGIAATRSGELRFLGEAFDRLGREYPSTRDGLSLTERRLLAAAAAEPGATAAAAFTRMGEREPRPFLGDGFGFGILARLAGARVPLVEADPSGGVAAATRVRVTEAGRRVLAGEADHVALNGIDRWVGGVHLYGEAAPWRWDEGTETVAGPLPA